MKKDIILIAIIVFCYKLFSTVFFYFIPLRPDIYNILSSILFMLLPALIYYNNYFTSDEKILVESKDVKLKLVAKYFIISILLFLVYIIINSWFEINYEIQSDNFEYSLINFLAQSIIILFLVLLEEFVFRVVILKIFLKYSAVIGILYVSLLFMSFHNNVISSMMSFFLSIILCHNYLKDGKLFYLVMTHFMYNLMIYTFSLLKINIHYNEHIINIIFMLTIIFILIILVFVVSKNYKIYAKKISLDVFITYIFILSISLLIWMYGISVSLL